jgi:hypothetical protein
MAQTLTVGESGSNTLIVFSVFSVISVASFLRSGTSVTSVAAFEPL